MCQNFCCWRIVTTAIFFQCHLYFFHVDIPEVEELEEALNGDRKNLDRLVRNLR